MNGQKAKMEFLGNAPIPKVLLAIGIPTMLGMMVNALYNLVDAMFVGGLGTSQMGAISVVYPLGQVVVGLGLLFGNGAASYISRLLGSGDKDTANKVATTALFCSIGIGAIMILFSILFLNPLLHLLGATDSIMPYAKTYATIYIISCIFNIFNVTMNNLITSEGAAKTTMIALMTGAVINIGLDPIFIYSLGFEIAGAALATAISQVISSIVYLLYLSKKKSVFRFHIQDFCPSKAIMSEIFKIGVPTLIFQLLTSISISLINTQSMKYGDSIIAAMGAVTRLISMGSLMVFGFIKGFQPIAGYSYGAKKYDRLREAIKISILWSTIFCVIYGIILAIFSSPIIAQFTSNDSLMMILGKKALIANGLSFMLFGFSTVYSSLFLALGKGKEGFILGACRQGICFLPVIYLLPALFGVNGILFAQPVADVGAVLVTIFMSIQINNELRNH